MVTPTLGETLRWTMASAGSPVSECTPEMRRERRQWPGRLWINMRARPTHPCDSGLAVEIIIWTPPFLMVVEVGTSMSLL